MNFFLFLSIADIFLFKDNAVINEEIPMPPKPIIKILCLVFIFCLSTIPAPVGRAHPSKDAFLRLIPFGILFTLFEDTIDKLLNVVMLPALIFFFCKYKKVSQHLCYHF